MNRLERPSLGTKRHFQETMLVVFSWTLFTAILISLYETARWIAQLIWWRL